MNDLIVKYEAEKKQRRLNSSKIKKDTTVNCNQPEKME
jgi:hypothetical protein